MAIKKKLAAVAAAAMMAMSITAMSASAANTDIYDCTLEQSNAEYTLNGVRAYGIFAVGMDGENVYNSNINGNFFAETYYRAPAQNIKVTMEIHSNLNNKVIDTFTDSHRSTTTPSKATVATDDDYGVVTVYCSHEIQLSNNNGTWGEYTAIRNVE